MTGPEQRRTLGVAPGRDQVKAAESCLDRLSKSQRIQCGIIAPTPNGITFLPDDDLRAAGAGRVGSQQRFGLPVESHVACGPIRIPDGKLVSADVLRRTILPFAIEIGAYQLGRGVEPIIQTATLL